MARQNKFKDKKMRKSSKFDNAICINGVHYFPEDLKKSNVREGKDFEIQACFFQGKWKQDTFYITKELATNLVLFKTKPFYIKCRKCSSENEIDRDKEISIHVHHLECNYCPNCAKDISDDWEQFTCNKQGEEIDDGYEIKL